MNFKSFQFAFLKFSTTLLLAVVMILTLGSCSPVSTSTSQVEVSIIHDGKTDQIQVSTGQTVTQAIASDGITMNSLDRVEPDSGTLVSANLTIKVIRVTESYVSEETTLPFESQTIKNESLTAGQTILIQAGQNGSQSVTYRILSEDGMEVSRTISKTEIIQEAQPEIIMVGVQSSFRALDIDGMIAYISSSNAWLMESNTGNRRALVTTGDLDGRIFSISPDHDWLLFSRKTKDSSEEVINTLWVVNLTESDAKPLQLSVDGKPIVNVVNYANWVPAKAQTITYSTVEYRSAAPGWQANNDLQLMKFNASGGSSEHKTVIDTNPGGIYGWWGTVYFWSPDASEIAYARPDGIGLVDSKSKSLNSLIDFSPYNTQSDWAWVPSISWTDDHSFFYTVLPNSDDAGNSQFDLKAFLTANDDVVDVRQNVGMFAYPAVSSMTKEGNYRVAFLSASIPEQSSTSRYSLRVMDQDGSNDKNLYPDEGVQGLDAQQVVWSPAADMIAFIAQGNLLFIDPSSGAINQITGDGSVSRIDWK